MTPPIEETSPQHPPPSQRRNVIPAKERHPSEGWELNQIPAYARMTEPYARMTEPCARMTEPCARMTEAYARMTEPTRE